MSNCTTNIIKAVRIDLDCNVEMIKSRWRPLRPLCCPFRVCVDEFCFPDRTWDDFVVVILTSWLNELSVLNAVHGAYIDLLFMDGPYGIRIIPRGEIATFYFFANSRDNIEIKFECKVIMNKFRNTALEAAKNLSDMVHRSNVDDIDIDELDRALQI